MDCSAGWQPKDANQENSDSYREQSFTYQNMPFGHCTPAAVALAAGQ